MATLGELERQVMDLLWATDDTLSAYDIQATLAEQTDGSKALAATTVLTVLSRLEAKGFVQRERSVRPHRYRAAASREDHMADLMHEVLGGASNRTAVLERFVGQVGPEDAEALRRLLAGR
ncbi:putative transcriptional regulator [Microbacteriaceae bacterium SG_E_30_P1]|uniref:Transcriptional regulator n=1 Tax=Antiquaquibacter oligotrophicus TaxID=2880260 RepID=A0ABT6KS59_9MICO|nr:BlaI/MecI/CopY family transcriptional regulator [Antiquaquibacter oligotrophicus]MDH6182034.1 putative transcriptional regulator [Antiquaquibacter oligotrophicus]UDF12298.1 BlaI/MecI/CopY family transcriptional regulator [Antiquaquibacter oligotrophicus]